MESIDLLIVILVVLLIAGISRRIQTTILTVPMLCMVLGLLAGLVFPDLISLSYDDRLVEIIATITLVMLLATDSSRISVQSLYRFHDLPMRLLFIGLPLTMILGTILANAMFGDLMFWEAAVLAVCLAPTDTSPTERAVENPSVPVRIRQALDIEGSLNDGITMPILLMTISMAASAQSGIGQGRVLEFATGQIVFGVLVGLLTGYLGAKYIYWGKQSGWMSTRFLKICWLALIILTYTAAEFIGGNGYIASFVFGITSGNVIGKMEEEPLQEFAAAENSLLMLATYVIFGMVMLTKALENLNLTVVMFALLSLTVVRMLPVAISMIGTKLRAISVLYMGWFGPRGIATILYVITVIGREDITGNNLIYDIAIITVALSLILQGSTAWPLSEWYGKRIAQLDKKGEADAEMVSVPEMPTRAGRGRAGDRMQSVSETGT